MIKTIYANGPYLSVEVTNQSYTAPYINMSNASAGMVRYNNNQLEVYDGSAWHSIGGNGSAMISMNHNAMNAIMWAEKKMLEEADIMALAKKHPAVADAVAQVQQAENQLRVITALIKEHQQ